MRFYTTGLDKETGKPSQKNSTPVRVEIPDKEVFLHAEDIRNRVLVPSVTTIMNFINQDHIIRWQKKNCLEELLRILPNEANQDGFDFESKSLLDQALDYEDRTASDFGTVCHGLCEQFLTGKPNKDAEGAGKDHLRSVAPFKMWADQCISEVIFTEKSFIDRKRGYAGTVDLGVITTWDTLATLDYKFKKDSPKYPMHVDAVYKFQLSAYRDTMEDTYGPDMETGSLLLARCNDKWTKPRIDANMFGTRSFTEGFNACYTIWKALYEVE